MTPMIYEYDKDGCIIGSKFISRTYDSNGKVSSSYVSSSSGSLKGSTSTSSSSHASSSSDNSKNSSSTPPCAGIKKDPCCYLCDWAQKHGCPY